MKSTLSLIFIGLLILLLSGQARATLQVSPYLTLVEQYTDNLFLSADNEQDDWMTTARPGIGLVYDSVALEFDIDYSLKFRYYNVYKDGNETAFRDVQRSNVHALLFPERAFRVYLDGEISRVTIDERDAGIEESELLNATSLYKMTANPQYQWDLSNNFSVTFDYFYRISEYESTFGDDTSSHEYSLRLNKKVSASTDLLLRYSFLDHQANFYRNFELQTLTLGFAHQLGPRLVVEADAGLVLFHYDNGIEKRNTTGKGRLSYLLSRSLTLSFSHIRDYAVSVSRGLIRRENTAASLIYSGRATIEGEIYFSDEKFLEDEALSDNETRDKILGAILRFNVPLMGHVYIDGFGNFKTLNYLPVDEKIDRYAIGSAIGYAFNKFDVSLGYTFRVNESNIDVNDYKNNLVTLQGSLRY